MEKALELQKRLEKRVWEREQSLQARKATTDDLESLRYQQSNLEKSSIFFQLVFDKKKDELRQRFEKLADYGLQKIFGPGIRLKIDQRVKNNRVYNDIMVERLFEGEWHKVDPLEEDAGGVVDVVSFLMRVLVMMFMVPRPRRLLVLDEPGKHLSSDLKPKFAQLLRDLCDKLGVQIIMVTHASELTGQADVVYSMNKGEVTICEKPISLVGTKDA